MWRSICSSVDDFVRDAVAVVLRVSPCCASVGVAAKVDLDLLGGILRSARVASRSARAARIARRALSIRRTCTRLFVFSRRWNLRPAVVVPSGNFAASQVASAQWYLVTFVTLTNQDNFYGTISVEWMILNDQLDLESVGKMRGRNLHCWGDDRRPGLISHLNSARREPKLMCSELTGF